MSKTIQLQQYDIEFRDALDFTRVLKVLSNIGEEATFQLDQDGIKTRQGMPVRFSQSEDGLKVKFPNVEYTMYCIEPYSKQDLPPAVKGFMAEAEFVIAPRLLLRFLDEAVKQKCVALTFVVANNQVKVRSVSNEEKPKILGETKFTIGDGSLESAKLIDGGFEPAVCSYRIRDLAKFLKAAESDRVLIQLGTKLPLRSVAGHFEYLQAPFILTEN